MRNLIQQGLAIRDLARERILVMDGAMGTMLQQQHLTAADFGGQKHEGCFEYLAITRPDILLGIHRAYLATGAHITKTDSFGGAPFVLAEFGLGDRARGDRRTAAALARQAADEVATAARPRFVAGSMGPTTKAISVTGGITFDQLRASFLEQARADSSRVELTCCFLKPARTPATSRPASLRSTNSAANSASRFR